jgi:hypothetical protein
VFSIANGFMEELWFRGSWSSSFRQVLGPSMAMHVTSVVFCVTHVIVCWQEPMSMLLLAPRLAVHGLRVRRHHAKDRIAVGAGTLARDRQRALHVRFLRSRVGVHLTRGVA